MKTAADVMHRPFFHASPSDTIGVLLQEMAERGMGSVPVLDAAGRPLGVATAAEIERSYDIDELIEGLHRRAICVDHGTPIDVAARTLAAQPSCSLLVVDGSGVAVGALTPLDLLQAVLGVTALPGASKLHERESPWEQADVLDIAAAHRAPGAPGIIMLSPGVDDNAKRIIWAESARDMRERLDQMLREPQEDEALEGILAAYPRSVRFRCLTVRDEAQREQLAAALCNIGIRAAPAAQAVVEPEVVPRGSAGARNAAPLAALDS